MSEVAHKVSATWSAAAVDHVVGRRCAAERVGVAVGERRGGGGVRGSGVADGIAAGELVLMSYPTDGAVPSEA